jgi:hypothetical protein
MVPSEWIELDVVRRLTPTPAQTPTPAHTPAPTPTPTPKAEEAKHIIDHIKASELDGIEETVLQNQVLTSPQRLQCQQLHPLHQHHLQLRQQGLENIRMDENITLIKLIVKL